jgi:hypothetical protein
VIEPAVKPVISHEDRAVVLVINPVPEMSVPGGIAIISISGEFIFIDLGITSGSDEAGGYNGCEDK